MGSLCVAECAANRFDWCRVERGHRISDFLRGDWTSFARPAVEEAHVWMSVVEKRSSDQHHMLVWDIVYNDGAAIADAELSRDRAKFFRTHHLAVCGPGNSIRAGQVDRAGYMTGRISLGWTGTDDACGGILSMLRKPVRVSQQLGSCVATLMHGNDRHDLLPERISPFVCERVTACPKSELLLLLQGRSAQRPAKVVASKKPISRTREGREQSPTA